MHAWESTDVMLGAHIGSGDPGAVGVNKLWINTTALPYSLSKRNSGNSGWDLLGYLLPISGDFKDSVRVATTANITLSGAQTIDGVSVIAGDRVLVKDQSTGSQNGIYVCASGSWTRATDADSSAEVTTGLFVNVEEGTANGDKSFVLTTNNPITIGTTALVFASVGGGGGGGTTINSTDGVIPYRSNSTTFSDSPLTREDANTMSQRNGTTAQVKWLYKTWSSAGVNYEGLKFSSDASFFIVSGDFGGTGASRGLKLLMKDAGGSFIGLVINAVATNPAIDSYQTLGSASVWWLSAYISTVNLNVLQFLGSMGKIDAVQDGMFRMRNNANAGGNFLCPPVRPSQITADQNNYDTSSIARTQYWNSNATRNVTGFSPIGIKVDGQEHIIINSGSFDIVLKHQDAGSSAANRFLCSTGADITLSANQSAEFNYDNTTQRWRVFKRN
jgi:hypothetical protein